MPKERLYQGRRFTFRNGISDFYWKGMATKPDPAAQPPDRPRLVINGRYLGGNIISRPPLKPKIADIPLQTGLGMTDTDWELAFMGEHHSTSGQKLWWGASFVDTYTGGSYGYIDTDNDPEHVEVGVYLQAASIAPVLVYYGGFIYAGASEALRKIYRITQVPGAVSPVPVRLPEDEIAVATPGYWISALHVHDGVLYYVKSCSTGNGAIYSWDGYENRKEHDLSSGAANGAAITTFQDKVVVTANGETDLHYRDSAGSWTGVALTSASGYTNSMAQLRNKLYIAGGADVIYYFDGSAIGVARTITGGTAPEGVNCLTVLNERLYYSWRENTGETAPYCPWLGVFDPDTHASSTYRWKDDYVSLFMPNGYAASMTFTDSHSVDGEHPGSTEAVSATAMCVYRQRIFVALAGGHIATHAVVNNPYSDWYVVHPFLDYSSVGPLQNDNPPKGPVRLPLQVAATGDYNKRLISSFKVF